MHKPQYFFSLLILSLFQGVLVLGQQDPKALEILNAISEKTTSYPAIKADFTYIIEDDVEKTEYKNDGSILLKGDRYILELLGTTVYYDGKTMWNYLTDANEVNITEPDEEETDVFFTNPSQIFSLYKGKFKVRYIGIVKESNRDLVQIDLYPMDINYTFFRIRILADAQNNDLYSIKASGKEGNHYTVIFKDIQPVNNLNDNTFVFDPSSHPDIEVIDLR